MSDELDPSALTELNMEQMRKLIENTTLLAESYRRCAQHIDEAHTDNLAVAMNRDEPLTVLLRRMQVTSLNLATAACEYRQALAKRWARVAGVVED